MPSSKLPEEKLVTSDKVCDAVGKDPTVFGNSPGLERREAPRAINFSSNEVNESMSERMNGCAFSRWLVQNSFFSKRRGVDLDLLSSGERGGGVPPRSWNDNRRLALWLLAVAWVGALPSSLASSFETDDLVRLPDRSANGDGDDWPFFCLSFFWLLFFLEALPDTMEDGVVQPPFGVLLSPLSCLSLAWLALFVLWTDFVDGFLGGVVGTRRGSIWRFSTLSLQILLASRLLWLIMSSSPSNDGSWLRFIDAAGPKGVNLSPSMVTSRNHKFKSFVLVYCFLWRGSWSR